MLFPLGHGYGTGYQGKGLGEVAVGKRVQGYGPRTDSIKLESRLENYHVGIDGEA